MPLLLLAPPGSLLVHLLVCLTWVDVVPPQRDGGDESASVEVESFLEPHRSVALAPAEFGRVAAMHVSEGDEVRQGQLLAEVDARELQASLESAQLAAAAEGEWRVAEAEYRREQERLERLKGLQARGHANPEEVRRAELQVEIAAARLQMAVDQRRQRELEVARLEALIERRRCRAPFDGIVVEKMKHPGEFVATNEPQLLRLVKLHPLRATFSIAARHAVSLRPGQLVSVRITGGQNVPGAVRFVSPTVDGQTDTVRAIVEIPNPERTLKAGTSCWLTLPTAAHDAQSIPGERGRAASP